MTQRRDSHSQGDSADDSSRGQSDETVWMGLLREWTERTGVPRWMISRPPKAASALAVEKKVPDSSRRAWEVAATLGWGFLQASPVLRPRC